MRMNFSLFLYIAGYCIETTTSAGDGLKIRDVGGGVTGKKLFINVCSSVVIEEPTDKNGKPLISSRTTVADGLSIPLIVGPVRDQDILINDADVNHDDYTNLSTSMGGIGSGNAAKKELVVDVVVHPTVIEVALREKYFRAQVADLALDWVAKESGVECSKTWAFTSGGEAYHGGRGENRDVPVLFFVDASGAPVAASSSSGLGGGVTPGAGAGAAAGSVGSKDATASVAKGGSGGVLSSPSSLLSSISKSKDQAQDTLSGGSIDILSAAGAKNATKDVKSNASAANGASGSNSGKSEEGKKKQKPAGVLIQEIGPDKKIIVSYAVNVSFYSFITEFSHCTTS